MHWTNGMATLVHADARELPLPDKSVHCVVTSPPYFGLRNYGAGVEAGIGMEDTLTGHVDALVTAFREVRRVMRDDATLWLNYGDAYDAGTRAGRGPSHHVDVRAWQNDEARGGRRVKAGLGAKQLIGLPWRVALALQDDGWWLRSAIVWYKPNAKPENATDRPVCAYEMIFLLTKRPRYFYDAHAMRNPYSERSLARYNSPMQGIEMQNQQPGRERDRPDIVVTPHPASANMRNVWVIPVQPRGIKHFATFPDELPRRCIRAGTSEHGVCAKCGAPWKRIVRKGASGKTRDRQKAGVGVEASRETHGLGPVEGSFQEGVQYETLGWRPTCKHDTEPVPAVAFDPFVGSGTTVAVAQEMWRRGIGVDLSEEYLQLAKARLIEEMPQLPLVAALGAA